GPPPPLPAHPRALGPRRLAAPTPAPALPPAVVDDEDVAGLRAAERLEEDVDAAVVPRRQGAPRDLPAGDDRSDPRRRRAQRHAHADAGIRDERSGKIGEDRHVATLRLPR